MSVRPETVLEALVYRPEARYSMRSRGNPLRQARRRGCRTGPDTRTSEKRLPGATAESLGYVVRSRCAPETFVAATAGTEPVPAASRAKPAYATGRVARTGHGTSSERARFGRDQLRPGSRRWPLSAGSEESLFLCCRTQASLKTSTWSGTLVSSLLVRAGVRGASRRAVLRSQRLSNRPVCLTSELILESN